jgi:hypothetical protein
MSVGIPLGCKSFWSLIFLVCFLPYFFCTVLSGRINPSPLGNCAGLIGLNLGHKFLFVLMIWVLFNAQMRKETAKSYVFCFAADTVTVVCPLSAFY